MASMLKHKVTGEIFPYNADMARHSDLEVFEPVEAPVAVEGKRRGRRPAEQVLVDVPDVAVPDDLGDFE